MDPRKLPRLRSESGLTLIEILVATAILAIAIVIALLIYDQSRRSFKQGENAVEQQQAVRIAFDRLSADLRMAGYNYNPDGTSGDADEQIEAAYDGAIVIRGDFDESTEPALQGAAAAAVSVGNDEIVIYGLSKPSWIASGSGGQTLTFNADVKDVPRDGVVETVSVPNLALNQPTTGDSNPPYTLYRITLNPNVGTWGSPGFLTWTPMVENVRSLTFRYFGNSPSQLNPLDVTSTAEDIGGAETVAAKTIRTGIRRINVSIVGMTRDPDRQYVDTTDTNVPTQQYRKFELVGDITPRNLGMKGIRDLTVDNTPPNPPGAPTLTAGHCGGLFVSWPANAASEGVTAYKLYLGTSAGSPSIVRNSGTNAAFVSGLTTGTTYYVAVTAIDGAGNESTKSTEVNRVVTNTTTPTAPANVNATDNQADAINVTWSPTTTNTANLAGDPDSPMIRDLAGYRVYRGASASFTPAAGNRQADESILRASANPSYPDTNAVNCRTYFYKVRAVDTCGLESADSPPSGESGRAESLVSPQVPNNVQAFITGASQITLSWAPVTQNVNGATIYVDEYELVRRKCLILDLGCQSDLSGYSSAGMPNGGVSSGGASSYVDSTAIGISPTESWYYAVRARDDCPNYSGWTQAVTATCSFLGSLRWINPQNGDPAYGVTQLRAAVDSGGAETYTGAVIQITHATNAAGNQTVTPTMTTVGNVTTFSYDWLATPPGQYTVTITVTNSTGCTKSASIAVNAAPTVACCLSYNPGVAGAPSFLSCNNTVRDQGKDECRDLNYKLWNNACLTSVRIDTLTISWTNTSTDPKLARPALLDSVFFDGVLYWRPDNAATPASTTFAVGSEPTVPYTQAAANTVDVKYRFDTEMSRESGGKHQPVLTTFQFTLLDSNGQPTAITGTCGPPEGFNFAVPEPTTP